MTAATNIPACATAPSVFIFTATFEIITFPNCFLNWCNKTKQSTQAGLKRCQSTRTWSDAAVKLPEATSREILVLWAHVEVQGVRSLSLSFKTSRKQLWPVCWCRGSEPARSFYTLTADSCMTVSHLDIFQWCIWPASVWRLVVNDCCSTWYRSTYIRGEKRGLLTLASLLFDSSIDSVRLWASMVFFLRQIDDKWQCDNSRITSAEDAILTVQSHHMRILKGRSTSTTTPNDSVLRGKYLKYRTKRLFRSQILESQFLVSNLLCHQLNSASRRF